MIQQQNGSTLFVNGNYLIYNGVRYELPKSSQKRYGHSVTQINNKVFIDGYEFKNGTFRRTLAALFHLIF